LHRAWSARRRRNLRLVAWKPAELGGHAHPWEASDPENGESRGITGTPQSRRRPRPDRDVRSAYPIGAAAALGRLQRAAPYIMRSNLTYRTIGGGEAGPPWTLMSSPFRRVFCAAPVTPRRQDPPSMECTRDISGQDVGVAVVVRHPDGVLRSTAEPSHAEDSRESSATLVRPLITMPRPDARSASTPQSREFARIEIPARGT
jgi:hypothetical protein